MQTLRFFSLILLFLSPPSFALFPEEPWARQVMGFADTRVTLLSCNVTSGTRNFVRPMPKARYYCLARPQTFNGKSILIYQLRRREWLYFEIAKCKMAASESSGSSGYLQETCEVTPLSAQDLRPKGRTEPALMRTVWGDNGGGIFFHFRSGHQSYSGMPMNLHELKSLNR